MERKLAQSRGERLVNEFVESLASAEALDGEVVLLLQGLHQRGRLGSTDLLRELTNQREEWEDAEAS